MELMATTLPHPTARCMRQWCKHSACRHTHARRAIVRPPPWAQHPWACPVRPRPRPHLHHHPRRPRPAPSAPHAAPRSAWPAGHNMHSKGRQQACTGYCVHSGAFCASRCATLCMACGAQHARGSSIRVSNARVHTQQQQAGRSWLRGPAMARGTSEGAACTGRTPTAHLRARLELLLALVQQQAPHVNVLAALLRVGELWGGGSLSVCVCWAWG